MSSLRLLPASDPQFTEALRTALQGGPPLAPLPPNPDPTLAMLRPDEPVTEEDAAVIVATSGSTGTPKGVVLSAGAIRASVEATHARLGGPGSWTLALPAYSVAGLMVLARAILGGTRVQYADPHLADLPGPAERGYLSLVPTQLVRALDRPELADRLAEYDAVLLGGAAAPASTLRRARSAGIPVVATYGMSETCGGCVYDGLPLPGVAVGVDPRTQRISLTGEQAFSGYRLEPGLTREVLHGHTVRTRDRGELAAGRLQVLGRLDDVVTSGGVNVDLAVVERLSRLRWPDSCVIGVPDRVWGTLVVLATTAAISLADVRAALPGLEAAALPRGLFRLDELPMTGSGKVDRQRLIGQWRGHDSREVWESSSGADR